MKLNAKKLTSGILPALKGAGGVIAAKAVENTLVPKLGLDFLTGYEGVVPLAVGLLGPGLLGTKGKAFTPVFDGMAYQGAASIILGLLPDDTKMSLGISGTPIEADLFNSYTINGAVGADRPGDNYRITA